MESKQYVLMTKMYSEKGQSYEKFFGGTMIFERYLNNISKTWYITTIFFFFRIERGVETLKDGTAEIREEVI